jgi:hypothetical protein
VLAEVKSTTKVKPEHLPDVAVQLHVLRKTGIDVQRAEVMHLNRACRHPNLKKLFVRQAVTKEVAPSPVIPGSDGNARGFYSSLSNGAVFVYLTDKN